MESTQTSPMFISLTETEEANLSGGESTVNTTIITNGAPGQDGAPGQNGAPGQDGAPGQNGVSTQNAVSGRNVKRPKRIKTRKKLLEKLLSRLESIWE